MELMETEILIVGAGPCGLMLANELGRRNIQTIVVDAEEGVATAPQANATQARSMEHYRRLGFANDIRKMGLPIDHPTDVAYFTTLSGYELARHKMPCSKDADQFVRDNFHIWNGPELPHRVPQSRVEQKLLEEALRSPSVRVKFLHEHVSFIESDNGIIADIRDLNSSEVHQISCKYIFAADGAQSVVRKQLGIRYAGSDVTERDFMGGQMLSIYIDMPAFYTELKIDKAWMYWIFNRNRRGLLATVDGFGKFVYQTQLRPGEDIEEMTKAHMAKMFLQALGRDIPFEITGMASWLAGRGLVADKFASERVFMGGDAVHIFTPTGGMGYNTAIEDAANIGWKFAAVLKGQADPALLNSYEVERRPIAHRNTRFALEFADSVGLYAPSPAIDEEGPAGQAARRRSGAYLNQHAAREFTIPGFTLGARYDASPIIVSDETPLPPDAASVYAPSAKPGGRAPHLWLSDGGSLFDAFGFEWTLLILDPNSANSQLFAAEAEKRGLHLTQIDLSNEPIAVDFYQSSCALIRPDQIVAWRGEVVDEDEVIKIFDQVCGRG